MPVQPELVSAAAELIGKEERLIEIGKQIVELGNQQNAVRSEKSRIEHRLYHAVGPNLRSLLISATSGWSVLVRWRDGEDPEIIVYDPSGEPKY